MHTHIAKVSFVILLIANLLFTANIRAQQAGKCAFDRTVHSVIKSYPVLADTFHSLTQDTRAAYKTTVTSTFAIPVVFHIVLTQAQLDRIGGTLGVEQRIDSQLIVLNRDFNAQNADSANIPAPFKPR